MKERCFLPGAGAGAARAALGATLLLLGTGATVAADKPQPLDDAFAVSLASFILSSDTKVRLDGDTSAGTEFDWENTFGIGDATRFRVDGQWRFAERHKLRFLWFRNSNTRSKKFEQDIEWNGVVYPVSAKVKGEFDFDVYELAYEYSFLRRDTYEINGSIGLHYTDLGLALTAKAEASGGALEADLKESASVGAPLPVIGLRGMWVLPHDFVVDATAQFFALSIDQYDGHLTDYKIALTWQPKKWLGIGVGYNQFGVDVDVDEGDFKGTLDWTYRGPMLFYSATF